MPGADGRRHLAWMITWLEGVPLAATRYRSPALLHDLGTVAAAMARELREFDDAALHRAFYWDLAHSRWVVDDQRELIDDREVGTAVAALIRGFDLHSAPHLRDLRRSAIHNDLSDYNVLVGGGAGGGVAGGDVESRNQRVVGVVDFGDMVYSYTVGDLAIVIAYAILDA